MISYLVETSLLFFNADDNVYSENARVCAKWLWNAQGCYWIPRPTKPGVQSSKTGRVRFTVISHTPGRSRFYHIHIVSKRNWDGTCLMNWTQQSYFFFKFAFCSIVLLNFGETCHLKGRVMVTLWRTLLFIRWYDCSELWRHAVWTRIVT